MNERWIPLIWTPEGWAMAFIPFDPFEPGKRATCATREEALMLAQKAALMSGRGYYDAAEVRMPPPPPATRIPGDVPVNEY